jgi:hypothetical protein
MVVPTLFTVLPVRFCHRYSSLVSQLNSTVALDKSRLGSIADCGRFTALSHNYWRYLAL